MVVPVPVETWRSICVIGPFAPFVRSMAKEGQ